MDLFSCRKAFPRTRARRTPATVKPPHHQHHPRLSGTPPPRETESLYLNPYSRQTGNIQPCKYVQSQARLPNNAAALIICSPIYLVIPQLSPTRTHVQNCIYKMGDTEQRLRQVAWVTNPPEEILWIMRVATTAGYGRQSCKQR
jgi:hypothetical protein